MTGAKVDKKGEEMIDYEYRLKIESAAFWQRVRDWWNRILIREPKDC